MLTPFARRGIDCAEMRRIPSTSPATTNHRYQGFALQRGDNDKQKVWGGKKASADQAATSNPAPNTLDPVAQLQTDLKALGVYTKGIDGDYGGGTETAVKRFQWNAKNIPNRILAGASLPVSVADRCFTEAPNGKITTATAKEIASWIKNKHTTTGDLVRLDVSSLKNMRNGAKKIVNPSVQTSEIFVSRDMVEDIKAMDKKAGELGIEVYINQTLRIVGVAVGGAVVTPAKKSQHLIGHAIDCNLIDGESWNTSKNFKADKETENAKKFIKAMTDRGLRWGGNWEKVDTPHFDRQVSASTDKYNYKFFFNQRTIAQKQPIAKDS